MLRKAMWLVAVAVLLVGTQASYATFSADLKMVADYTTGGPSVTGLQSGSYIPGGATVTMTIYDLQGYGTTSNSKIGSVELDFTNNSAALKAAIAAGTFQWLGDFANATKFDMPADVNISDLHVSTGSSAGTAVVSNSVPEPGRVALAQFTFAAPAPGITGYTIDLSGVGADPPTAIISSDTENNFIVFEATGAGSGMTGGQFNVLPEPATLALMGIGGVFALLRRRSR